MIHFQIIGLTTAGTGIFGLIGDLDTQPLIIGIMTGIALITSILGDRWLNQNLDKYPDQEQFQELSQNQEKIEQE